jgi:formylglycine-generating enzyme required for sulfatase activity
VRAIRGGHVCYGECNRCTSRGGSEEPTYRFRDLGFRCAQRVEEAKP